MSLGYLSKELEELVNAKNFQNKIYKKILNTRSVSLKMAHKRYSKNDPQLLLKNDPKNQKCSTGVTQKMIHSCYSRMIYNCY